MRTSILFMLLAGVICLQCMAQPIDTTKWRLSDIELGHYYLTKYKKQKTTAWIMLGVGSMAYFVSVGYLFGNYSGDYSSGELEAVALVSSLSVIGSIPLFISAAKNKGRAEILLRYENVPVGFSPKIPGSMPAVGIRVPLANR